MSFKLTPPFEKNPPPVVNVPMQQMKRGELDYDEKNVYFKGKKYPRSEFNEANKQLPWEIEAYKAG